VAFVNVTRGSGNTGAGISLLQTLVTHTGTSLDTPRPVGANATVQKFSERAIISGLNTTKTTFFANATIFDLNTTASELRKSINDPRSGPTNRFHGFNLLNIDVRGLNSTISSFDVWLLNTTSTGGILRSDGAGGGYSLAPVTINAIELANGTSAQQLFVLNQTSTTTAAETSDANGVVRNLFTMADSNRIGLLVNFTSKSLPSSTNKVMVADFFSFGYFQDGLTKSQRVNNEIVRIEAEETGDNTGVFEGSLEFVILNQLNILDGATYAGLSPISDGPSFIVHQDLDDEEAPRVNYNDLGADGVITQVADQEDAPTHSGVVSFNQPTYKKADTVVVTLEDQDLNSDVDLIDIYTVVNFTAVPAVQDTA
jgi:hypothetical protein